MRCKKHPRDLSSDVGVCASCLRERLFSVMVAQAEKQAEVMQDFRKKEIQPPDFSSFPRSVSPYISRTVSRHQNFFSTPPVSAAAVTVALGIREEEEEKERKKKGGKLSSLFFRIFRSKSDKVDPGRVTDTREFPTASPSWFSTVVSGRTKKQNRTFSTDDWPIKSKRKPYRYFDRGMSPVRNPYNEENGDSSGCSSDSSHQTPRRTPAVPRRKISAAHSVQIAGVSFCLSPLIRPSPSRQWNPKGLLVPDISPIGESRTPASRPRLSSAASVCKSRSRKLVDFGRNSAYYAND